MLIYPYLAILGLGSVGTFYCMCRMVAVRSPITRYWCGKILIAELGITGKEDPHLSLLLWWTVSFWCKDEDREKKRSIEYLSIKPAFFV
jgi:hypothetical protein